MAVEDIKKMYESAYNSQVGEIERQRQKSLQDATNRENQTKLQYKELVDGYNINKVDAKNRFYDDRNQVSTKNSQQVQQTRDWMAKNNLLQSGESVDAMLRNNTDLNNGLGAIATNETNSYRDINNKIGASEREKTQKLNELLDYRNSANEDFNSKKNSYYEQMQSNSIRDISAYNEQLRREQVQAEQQAQSYARQQASASSKAPTLQDEKESFLTQFKAAARSRTDSQSALNTLNDDKEEIITRYGKDYYGLLKDFYYSQSSQRITSDRSGHSRID